MTERARESQPDDVAELRALEFLGDEHILEMPSNDTIHDLEVDIEGIFRVFRETAVPEDDLDESQQFLRDILELMPTEYLHNSVVVQAYDLTRRFPELRANRCPDIPTIVWARRAAYHIAGKSYDDASKIHEQFKEVFSDTASWQPIVLDWFKTIKETDKDLFDRVTASSRIIAQMANELPYIQHIMATMFIEISYDQDLAHASVMEPDDIHSEALPLAPVDRVKLRRRGLAATKYTLADLEDWPADELLVHPDEIVDTEKLDIDPRPIVPFDDPKYEEPVINAKGEVLLNAIRLAKEVKQELKTYSLNAGDSHNMANRIDGEALKDHYEAIHWVRRVVFDHMGLSFAEHARASVQMYNEFFKIDQDQWADWLRGAEERLADNDELSQVLDYSIEFIHEDAGSRLREFYLSAAAITLEEIRHYTDVTGFKNSLEDIPLQIEHERLVGSDGFEPLPEPRIEPDIPIRRGGLMAHEVSHAWPADELLRDPQSKYDIDNPDKNPMIEPDDPDLIVPAGLTDEQKSINRIQAIIVTADKQSASDKPGFADMPVYYSKRMMSQLTGHEPSRDLIALSHRVRAVVFAEEGIDDPRHIGTIHHLFGGERSTLKPEGYVKLAEAARLGAFIDPSEAERFENELSLLIDIPERDEIVHHLAYLTLAQVRQWQQKGPRRY